MHDYIILNNKSSEEIEGLLIQSLPPISKPKVRTKIDEIDGRDGDLITKLGYSAYNKEFSIGLYGDYNLDEIISYFNSEGTVVFSNEQDKYYKYQILEQIDFEKLLRFKTAVVKMHIQPFKYEKDEVDGGEDAEVIEDTGSSLELVKTNEGKLVNFELQGKTTQDTRSGKNLLNYESLIHTSGMSHTINNNVLTLTGTGTWSRLQLQMQLKANTSYTLIGYVKATSGSNAGFLASNSSQSYQRYKFTSSGDNVFLYCNFDTSVDTNLLIQLYGNWSSINKETTTTFTNVMLLEGTYTTEQDFELYGVMPSPDYPSELKSVGYENLFHIENAIPTSDTNYEIVNRNTIRIYNTTAGSYKNAYVDIGNVNSGTYIFSCDVSKISGAERVLIQKIEDGVASTLYTLTNSFKQILTLNDKTYLRFVLYSTVNSGVGDITYSNIQLTKGTQAHSYIPFGKYGVEVVSRGKNFLDNSTITANSNCNVNNQEIVSNTLNNYGVFIVNVADVKLKPNTNYYVTFQAKKVSGSGYFNYAGAIRDDSQAVLVSHEMITRPDLSSSFQTYCWKINTTVDNFNGTTMYFQASYNASNMIVNIKDIVVSTVPNDTYEPYQENTTLFTLNEPLREWDRLYYENGKVYVERGTDKTIYDGSEEWLLSSSDTTNDRLSVYMLDQPFNTSNSNIFCNFFKVYGNNYRNFENYLTTNGNIIGIGISKSICSTIDAFKSWLSTHNTEVQYPLATPTIEDLGYIDMPVTYSGKTYIDTTDELEPDMYAKAYYFDKPLVVTNKGNIYSKPKITIYGSETIELYLNGYQIFTINLDYDDHITLDIAEMEAYKDTIDNLKNRLVIGNYDNFKLNPGENEINFTGTVSKIEIENYSRWI